MNPTEMDFPELIIFSTRSQVTSITSCRLPGTRSAARPQACFRSYKSIPPPRGYQSETTSLNHKISSSLNQRPCPARAGLAEHHLPRLGSRSLQTRWGQTQKTPQTRCCWSGALTNWTLGKLPALAGREAAWFQSSNLRPISPPAAPAPEDHWF